MAAVLSIADYAVVGATLLTSAAIGAHFACKKSAGGATAADDFLMGGRSMGLAPVVLSLAATAQTAVGTLGFPGEVYLYGAQLFLYPLGFVAALLLCAWLHTPVYFGLRLTSAYEYLELRFGKVTRCVISGLFIVQMVLFMSVGLYSPSIALSAVTGLSHIVSVVAVGSVCAFYCTLGGMRAVLWTDVLQAALMFFALAAVTVKGTVDIGGADEVVRIAQEGGRMQFFDTRFDPTLRFTLWSALIGGFMYGLTTYAANQTQVQRLLTVSTLRRSQIALLLSIPANLLMYYTLFTCGLVIYANLAGCDPLLQTGSSGIKSADQLLPYFVVRAFGAYPGMPGFCVSGIFCAALSSISSAVNSLAAVTHQDCLTARCAAKTALPKALALFYSLLCIAMTYLVGNIRAIIPAAFVVFTAIGGPAFSLITLGMTTTTANHKGGLFGLLCGIALNAWIGAGALVADAPQQPLPQSTHLCPGNFSANGTADFSTTEATDAMGSEVFALFRISFLLHPVPGTLATLVLGYLASYVTGGASDVDERLICPSMRKYLAANTKKDEKKASYPDTTQSIHPLDMSNGTAVLQQSQDKNASSKAEILEESKL